MLTKSAYFRHTYMRIETKKVAFNIIAETHMQKVKRIRKKSRICDNELVAFAYFLFFYKLKFKVNLCNCRVFWLNPRTTTRPCRAAPRSSSQTSRCWSSGPAWHSATSSSTTTLAMRITAKSSYNPHSHRLEYLQGVPYSLPDKLL